VDRSQRRKGTRLERDLGIMALLLMALAWVAGGFQAKTDVMPTLRGLMPGAQLFQSLGDNTYAAWADETGTGLLGYVKITRAMGYGGPVTVAVSAGPKGIITGIGVVDHKDTPSYFEKVMESGLIRSLLGKSHQDPLVLGRDIDGVSGATRTSSAIVKSTGLAIRDIASGQLGLDVPGAPHVPVAFGGAEAVLLALFGIGVAARRKSFRHTKTLRWVSLFIGLFALGFVYNSPFTIAIINQLLLGFWPDWHTHLYVYLLTGGIILLFLLEGKNPYCRWFCPFGAAQECLGKITKAKVRSSGGFQGFLKWLQRGLALAAILGALLFRDPGLTSYEVFATLFKMWGTAFQFLVIALVFLLSLYVLRPWCTYLCPVKPVEEFARMMKKWIKELRQRRQNA